MKNELVYHPKHYNAENRKECWEEMEELFGADAVAIFDILSAYKYHYRAGSKEGNPESQDLEKIHNYIRHAEHLICLNDKMTDSRKCLRVLLERIDYE